MWDKNEKKALKWRLPVLYLSLPVGGVHEHGPAACSHINQLLRSLSSQLAAYHANKHTGDMPSNVAQVATLESVQYFIQKSEKYSVEEVAGFHRDTIGTNFTVKNFSFLTRTFGG